MWRAGFKEMAIRCVERRRDISQPYGVGRRSRVILLNEFLLTTHLVYIFTLSKYLS